MLTIILVLLFFFVPFAVVLGLLGLWIGGTVGAVIGTVIGLIAHGAES